jgi:hypothetical protein
LLDVAASAHHRAMGRPCNSPGVPLKRSVRRLSGEQ